MGESVRPSCSEKGLLLPWLVAGAFVTGISHGGDSIVVSGTHNPGGRAKSVTAKGTVYHRDGNRLVPLPRLRVKVVDYESGRRQQTFVTDEHGIYQVKFSMIGGKVAKHKMIPDMGLFHYRGGFVRGEEEIEITVSGGLVQRDLVFSLHPPVEVRGVVKDAETGEPLSDVTVSIVGRLGKVTGSRDRIPVDKEGHFRVMVPNVPGLECAADVERKKGIIWDRRYRDEWHPLKDVLKKGITLKARERKLSVVIEVSYKGSAQKKIKWDREILVLQLGKGHRASIFAPGEASFLDVPPGEYTPVLVEASLPLILESAEKVVLKRCRAVCGARKAEDRSKSGEIEEKSLRASRTVIGSPCLSRRSQG
jgi:hypothetical protein